jgi:hypothetical protein
VCGLCSGVCVEGSWSGLPEAERYGGMAKLGCNLLLASVSRPQLDLARATDKVQGSPALGGPVHSADFREATRRYPLWALVEPVHPCLARGTGSHQGPQHTIARATKMEEGRMVPDRYLNGGRNRPITAACPYPRFR